MKSLANLILHIPAGFLLLCYAFNRKIIGTEKAFRSITEVLSLCPGWLGIYLRARFYNFVFTTGCKDVTIGFGTTFSKPEVTVGTHVYFGRFCNIGWVNIEKDVMVGDLVSIPSGGRTHKLAAGIPPRKNLNTYSKITIGEGSWIGSNSVIMASIGKYTVVGAGSVVTKPLPDNVVAAGAPAKIISPKASDLK